MLDIRVVGGPPGPGLVWSCCLYKRGFVYGTYGVNNNNIVFGRVWIATYTYAMSCRNSNEKSDGQIWYAYADRAEWKGSVPFAPPYQ